MYRNKLFKPDLVNNNWIFYKNNFRGYFFKHFCAYDYVLNTQLKKGSLYLFMMFQSFNRKFSLRSLGKLKLLRQTFIDTNWLPTLTL